METSKKLAALLVLVCLCWTSSRAQTLLYSEGFETDGEGSRYTSNAYNNALCDFFERSASTPLNTCFGGTTYTAFQGSFFWGSEDVMSSPGNHAAGSFTSSLINVTGYTGLQVSLFAATSNDNTTRWENADSINIKYSLNGGAQRVAGRFMGNQVAGGNLIVDANLNGVADVGEVTIVSVPTFTKYTFNITGTGSNLRIILDMDQIGGSEEFGWDLLEVRGTVVVPVKWSHFGAQQVHDVVQVDWATTEEVNAESFTVERLAGDGTYQPLGVVAAKGAASAYTFEDAHPLPGQNLYRIRQLDLDHAESFSETAEVNFRSPFAVTLYPNPSRDVTHVGFGGIAATGQLYLLDAMGKVVRTMSFADSQELDLDRTGLSAGLYHLRVVAAGQAPVSEKLLIVD